MPHSISDCKEASIKAGETLRDHLMREHPEFMKNTNWFGTRVIKDGNDITHELESVMGSPEYFKARETFASQPSNVPKHVCDLKGTNDADRCSCQVGFR